MDDVKIYYFCEITFAYLKQQPVHVVHLRDEQKPLYLAYGGKQLTLTHQGLWSHRYAVELAIAQEVMQYCWESAVREGLPE